jgi:hypothetical protein
MSDGQGWDTVYVMGGGARRAGASAPAKRPVVSAGVIAAAKLAAAEEPAKPKYFNLESVQAIQKYRRDNNLTQLLMDARCGLPAGTLNKLEGRQKTPAPRELQMLNNLLGQRLVVD